MTETETIYRPTTLAEVETIKLIRHFKHRKWRYLLVIFLSGCYSFYLFKFHLLSYSSTTSFIVTDHTFYSPLTFDIKGFDISSNDNFIRIYELVNSAATQKHLIQKFDLLNHYGIDSSKEFSYQLAVDRIRSNITISKSPFNAISVTVTDRYRYLAADMANEIVTFLETLNEELYVNNLQKKIKISESYMEQLKKENLQKTIAIDSMIQKLNLMSAEGKINKKNSYDFIGQQQMLSGVIGNFQNSTSELLNSQKLYNLSLQALNFKSYPTITTLRIAMPAPRSIAVTAFFLSCGIMVVALMILILQAYVLIHYRNFIRLILE